MMTLLRIFVTAVFACSLAGCGPSNETTSDRGSSTENSAARCGDDFSEKVCANVPDLGSASTSDGRVAVCAKYLDGADCADFEARQMLCDTGQPFCGYAKSAGGRVALCTKIGNAYSMSAAECQKREAAGSVCSNGVVDVPEVNDERCDQSFRRSS